IRASAQRLTAAMAAPTATERAALAPTRRRAPTVCVAPQTDTEAIAERNLASRGRRSALAREVIGILSSRRRPVLGGDLGRRRRVGWVNPALVHRPAAGLGILRFSPLDVF